MKKSERYLEAFGKIEKILRSIVRAKGHLPFKTLVKEAEKSNPVVKAFSIDLYEFGSLRNAIVHERTDGHVIAEPNNLAVEKIELIAKKLAKPRLVIPTFRANVQGIAGNSSLAEALSVMREHSFSQLPVYKEGKVVSLLTGDTISRWLAAYGGEPAPSMLQTSVIRVCKHAETKDTMCFIPARASIFQAIEMFKRYEEKGTRLEAILITRNGKADQRPLGIITAWDLHNAYSELNK